MESKDKNLIDRLNALKGGDAGVSLDPSSKYCPIALAVFRLGLSG